MADTPAQDRKAGLARERQGGRFVTAYAPEIAIRICERVAEGQTLIDICRDEGMPARQTFHRWVVQEPVLARAYAAARELSASSLEEEALGMARRLSTLSIPKDQIRALDVAMNQLRWSASKRNPRVYSDRGSATFVVPVQITTSLDLGEGGGGQSTEEHPNVWEIEATVTVPMEVEGQDNSKTMQLDTEPLKPKKAPRKNARKPKRKPRKRGQYGAA